MFSQFPESQVDRCHQVPYIVVEQLFRPVRLLLLQGIFQIRFPDVEQIEELDDSLQPLLPGSLVVCGKEIPDALPRRIRLELVPRERLRFIVE